MWAIHAVPVVEERTQLAALDPLVDRRRSVFAQIRLATARDTRVGIVHKVAQDNETAWRHDARQYRWDRARLVDQYLEPKPLRPGLVLSAPAVWGWSFQPWLYRGSLWLGAHTMGSRSVTPPDWAVRLVDAL